VSGIADPGYQRRNGLFFNFTNVFIFIILGLLMTFMIIMISRILAPRVQDVPDKFTTYECGERPVGSARILFNFRFYSVALAFLIFDIDLAFVFPAVVVYKRWLQLDAGLFALLEIVVFVGILFLGLIYMWNRGDLEWAKEVPEKSEEGIMLEEEKPIMVQGWSPAGGSIGPPESSKGDSDDPSLQ
jgi:NADH-quinone oxidoreductase subunit A